jgi:hypothetical protein
MAEFMEEFKFPDELEQEKKATKDAEDVANVVEPESEIEIVDDTPPEDRGRQPGEAPEEISEAKLSKYDESIQARMKKFTKGYHDERRAKEAAERERDEAIRAARIMADEAKNLQRQLEEGTKVFIDQGKSAAQGELEAAKRAFKDAYEAGDSDLLADAQARISQATIRIEKADAIKPLQPKEFDVQIPSYDVQEQQQPQIDPRTSQWLDENPWYGDDDEMSASALGLHKKLEKQFGKQYIGSEEYFKTIDATMKRRFPEYFGSEMQEEPSEEEEKPQTRAKPASNVVAPATRSTAPSKVKLTKSQVAIAKKLGVPLELYAKKVAEQMKGNQ